MKDRNTQIRIAVQKPTEAIWNLDQIDPKEEALKEEYERIQTAREKLMKFLKNWNLTFELSASCTSDRERHRTHVGDWQSYVHPSLSA